ncbi:MAG TPA: hypothetical protein PK095_03990, partial [Myxococcota bacterium]|nr:hypothetical protein [Myxococcota bacterium]
ADARDGVAGMYCVEARVEVIAQRALDFGGVRELEVGLRAAERLDGEVQVELCQTRGKARLERGVVMATVGETFELFFRLTGRTEARVLIEVYHPGGSAEVTPATV